MTTKRFWFSWEEPIDQFKDYRPNGQWPVPDEVRNYWCSGESETHFTMCAVVDAEDEEKLRAAVAKSWPNMGDTRFCEEKPNDWRPGDRFPWKEKAR